MFLLVLVSVISIFFNLIPMTKIVTDQMTFAMAMTSNSTKANIASLISSSGDDDAYDWQEDSDDQQQASHLTKNDSFSSTSSRAIDLSLLSLPDNRHSVNWWSSYANKIARHFVAWDHNLNNIQNKDDKTMASSPYSHYGWCILEKPNEPTHFWRLQEPGERAIGLIYIKLYKASSSTCEGISINIAHNVASRITTNEIQRQPNNITVSIATSTQTSIAPNTSPPEVPPCIHYNRHEFADMNAHSRQHRSYPNLLWTFVRDPYSRSLSHIYHFDISRKQSIEPTVDNIISKLEIYKSFQTMYLLPYEIKNNNLFQIRKRKVPTTASRFAPPSVQQVEHAVNRIQNDIIKYYDFIGITERMNESLATMILLWKLNVADVIVLSAKRSGGYDDGGYKGRCTQIQKPSSDITTSTILQDYVRNGNFSNYNADMLLYDAVNRSLDLTIEKVGGNAKVQSVVKLIEELQSVAETQCQREAVFPCSENGKIQKEKAKESCYVQDAGCGHQCVTKVLSEYIANHPTPQIFTPSS